MQQFSASPYKQPVYGQKVQYADAFISQHLQNNRSTYYNAYAESPLFVRAMDNTVIHALNNLASQVTTGTMKTEEAQECFLNHCAPNPDVAIVFK